MSGDPIATGTYVIIGLLFTFGPIIAGIVLINRGGSHRRAAQIDYLTWLAANGHSIPDHPAGMPMSMYPPHVAAAGKGLRTWGGILVGLGIFIFLIRLAGTASGV